MLAAVGDVGGDGHGADGDCEDAEGFECDVAVPGPVAAVFPFFDDDFADRHEQAQALGHVPHGEEFAMKGLDDQQYA